MPWHDPEVLNISPITPINPGPHEFKSPSREPPRAELGAASCARSRRPGVPDEALLRCPDPGGLKL
jgi:hypothetical protein